MNIQKAITYSLLAHIRNTATLAEGPLDIFAPLIKRALSKMNQDKIFSGRDLGEINEYAKKLYDIDFPTPVLRNILERISLELNESGAFILHNDNSFSIANYTFVEFDESVRKRKFEVEKLEQLFQDFCGKSELTVEDSTSIFSFLEKNKFSLAKYLSHTEEINGQDYLVEVQFVNYFKNIPAVYDLLKSLYLGSILAEYIEFHFVDIQTNIELLFDTNFIISLLDLNTPDSTNTCSTLLDIAKQQGYTLSILEETLEEIKFLLRKKSEELKKSFLVKQINMEDILNACDRRNLTQADLERIIDNLETQIADYGITTVSLDEKTKEKALKSSDYNSYKQKRTTLVSAKHDTYALYYVRSKRNYKKVSNFTDVDCWFVNNAISRGFKQQYDKAYQPEIIKADDLLSILWLSNPQISSNISSDEIADIGLSSLISLTFNASLPQTAIIKEFEDNIQKYAEKKISTQDIIKIATRIADKQLTNIDELNQLALQDQERFVERLEEEAKKQEKMERQRLESLSKIAEKFTSELEKVEELKQNRAEEKEVLKKVTQENQKNQLELEEAKKALEKLEIRDKVKKWQLKSRILFLVFSLVFFPITLYIYVYASEVLEENYMKLIISVVMIIWSIIVKLLYDRHLNNSNIENYKKSLE